MKTRIPFVSLIFCTIFFALNFVMAQKAELTKAFPKLQRAIPGSTSKVASHDDTPTFSFDFNWGTNWDSSGRYTYTYFPDGRLLSYQEDTYNNGAFVPGYQYSYTYNSSLQSIEFLEKVWNGTIWENNFRITSTYDSKGNLSGEIFEWWNSSAWEITLGRRLTHQYNGADEIIQTVREDFNTSNATWENAVKIDYTFVAGEWTGYDYALWSGGVWKPDSRILDVVWHNFANELPISGRYQYYESTTSTYEDAERFTCSYSQFDSYECIYETLNGTTWENDSREFVTKDDKGHEIFWQYSSWAGGWQLDSQYDALYAYDPQGRTLEIVNRELISALVWENYYKEVFVNFFVGTEDAILPTLGLTAFPNPAVTELNFELETTKKGLVSIALFDVQGRKRMETAMHYSGSTLSLQLDESLENGIYFYQVKTADGFAKGKFLIARE